MVEWVGVLPLTAELFATDRVEEAEVITLFVYPLMTWSGSSGKFQLIALQMG